MLCNLTDGDEAVEWVKVEEEEAEEGKGEGEDGEGDEGFGILCFSGSVGSNGTKKWVDPLHILG
jgi:hypothetical protein